MHEGTAHASLRASLSHAAAQKVSAAAQHRRHFQRGSSPQSNALTPWAEFGVSDAAHDAQLPSSSSRVGRAHARAALRGSDGGGLTESSDEGDPLWASTSDDSDGLPEFIGEGDTSGAVRIHAHVAHEALLPEGGGAAGGGEDDLEPGLHHAHVAHLALAPQPLETGAQQAALLGAAQEALWGEGRRLLAAHARGGAAWVLQRPQGLSQAAAAAAQERGGSRRALQQQQVILDAAARPML